MTQTLFVIAGQQQGDTESIIFWGEIEITISPIKFSERGITKKDYRRAMLSTLLPFDTYCQFTGKYVKRFEDVQKNVYRFTEDWYGLFCYVGINENKVEQVFLNDAP